MTEVTGRMASPARRVESDPLGRLQDRAGVLPALLAAIGESAFLYLPLHDVATNEGLVVAGPMTHYALFVVVFAGAVAAATWLRGYSKFLPVIVVCAVAMGVIQGIWWGEGDAVAATTSVVVWLIVAARVFTLALRDWRDPIATSFGVGTAALLAEIVLMGSFAEPRSVLPIAVPQFFLASLASRAASLRLSRRQVTFARVDSGRPSRAAAGTGPRIGMGLLGIAVLGLLMAAALGLGGKHGGLLLLGKAILAAVLPFLAYVLAPIAKFLLEALIWLFALLHIDLSPLRSIAETVGNFRARPPQATSAGGGPVGRILAFLVLVALGFLLVRTIRVRWRRFERKGGGGDEVPEPTPTSIFAPGRRRKGARSRLELPADTVRRWYAEALLVLERLGLPKAPSRTPGEYLREVTLAFPECAPGFTALTRAYEDVRYGSRRFAPDTLGSLEANRQLAMSALSRADRLEESPGEEAT
jgi:uncharacterized protein DUF4129